MRVKHGHTATGWQSPTYISWRSMLRRCREVKHRAYARYGGRGILVCERWMSFPAFLADMGERPTGKTLDRFPNKDGYYEPGNCRWATSSEQLFNTKRTVLPPEKRRQLAEKARELGSKTLASIWAEKELGCSRRHAFNLLMPKKQALSRVDER